MVPTESCVNGRYAMRHSFGVVTRPTSISIEGFRMKSASGLSRKLRWLLATFWLMSFTLGARGQTQRDLSDASLEDLLNIRVSSVTRTERTLSQTASSVFVITADDIRQSGGTSIAEILRIVPGLDVARINASSWAISVRGLNGRFANELLVMVDGRPVYSPTFGACFGTFSIFPSRTSIASK